MRARSRCFPDGRLGPAALRNGIETLKLVVVAAVVLYAAIVGVVWLAQESLVFYPQPPVAKPAAPAGWRLEDVDITMRDGTRLAGLLALPDAPARPALVIYFGGNAEEVTAYAGQTPQTYGSRAALFVNYRGYGRSQGKPSESSLVSDGVETFDWAAKRADVDGSRIAIHGRSIGTGVAVQVAAARPPRCIVLTSPFSSAVDVAREFYPWLPVSALLRHRFDSAAKAPGIKVPALIFSGSADTIIPPHHTDKLAAAWGGPVERVKLEGFGHNDIDLHPGYAKAIRAFLDRCLA